MEIYFDLENTLMHTDKALPASSLEKLKKLTEKHKVFILTTATLMETIKKLDIPNLEIVSTIENKSYYNKNYLFEPIDCQELNSIINSSNIYTLFAIEGNTSYIIKYQERMKRFYPGGQIKICSQFPKSIAAFQMAVYNSGLESIKAILKGYHIETLAQDAKKTLLLISKTPSTKESWLLKLKKSPAIGIGDSISDYSFIKHCEFKVAMKNGDEELKNHCTYVTEKTNQEDGALDFVIPFLKHQQV